MTRRVSKLKLEARGIVDHWQKEEISSSELTYCMMLQELCWMCLIYQRCKGIKGLWHAEKKSIPPNYQLMILCPHEYWRRRQGGFMDLDIGEKVEISSSELPADVATLGRLCPQEYQRWGRGGWRWGCRWSRRRSLWRTRPTRPAAGSRRFLKPNSWMYNCVEVSGLNLEKFSDLRFNYIMISSHYKPVSN